MIESEVCRLSNQQSSFLPSFNENESRTLCW